MPPQPVDPGAVVARAIELLRRHFAVLYPVALIFGLLEAMVSYALQDTSAAGIGLAFSLVAGTFFQGMVVGFVRDVEAGLPSGTEPSVGALLRSVAPVVGPLLGVSILSAAGIGLGFLLLIVPGLVLLTIWAVVAPVVVLERVGVFASFGRSRELVRGHGRQVFLTLMLLFLLLLPAGLIAVAATEGLGGAGGAFVQVLVVALATTVSVLGTATLYFRLREAEAAGTPAVPSADGAEDEPVAERRW